MTQHWQYCLLTCTPMTGVEDEGIRLAYQLVTPEGARQLELRSENPLPLAAIGQLLNDLGQDDP
jgi:hypothetical protein